MQTITKKSNKFLNYYLKITNRKFIDIIRSILLRISIPITWKLVHFNLLSIKNARSINTFIKLGYYPNVNNPKTFNEHILKERLKKHSSIKNALILSDKLLVRDYVKSRMGDSILPKLYYIVDKLDELDFTVLPNEFVIKTNNGSSSREVIIVRNKKSLDQNSIKKEISNWLDKGTKNFHKHENLFNIPTKIFIEEYLKDNKNISPIEFRCFTINGILQFIEVIQNRFSGTIASTIYDKNWRMLPFTHGIPKGNEIEKPKKMNELLNIVNRLSEGLIFARIDLYYINNSDFYFGEITISPGLLPFNPVKYDFHFGDIWNKSFQG